MYELETTLSNSFVFCRNYSESLRVIRTGPGLIGLTLECSSYYTGAENAENPDNNPWVYDTIGDPGEA